MANVDQLKAALIKADAAGDTAAARALAAELRRVSAPPAAPKLDPAAGGSTLKVLNPFGKDFDTGINLGEGMTQGLAGAGKAFVDTARGIGQMVGAVDRKDVEAARKLDAPLMDTGAGKVGNFGGNLALALPTLAIPGAATVRGAALIGAGQGLIQPSTSTSETLSNVGLGGALGGGSIIAGRAVAGLAGGVKALAEPFSQAGREKIAGRMIQRFAEDPTTIARATSAPTVTGALPTLAEQTGDRGLAQLQDALRSVDPQIGSMIAERLAANNGARVNTLRNIARTPADREAAVAAVEAQARDLYGQAFQESVPVTPALQRLVGKPSVQKAEARAIQLAREQGTPFQARLEDMRPRSVYAGMRDLPESSFVIPDNPGPVYAGTRQLPDSTVQEVTQRFSPLTLNPQPVTSTRYVPSGSQDLFIDLPPGLRDLNVASGRVPTFVDIPPVESVPVRDMHTLKMGMDALLSDPTLGIAGREAAAVKATRNRLLDLLPESYQVARRAHIQMNKPVNQMDIGNRLLQTYASATEDLAGNPTLRAEAFNRALQNEPRLIKQATGVKGINSLADVMEPEQLAAIRGVADELGRASAVAQAGNGPGSATAQRMASQNILRQLIGPTGLPSSWAESAVANTVLGKPFNLIYGGVAEPKIQQALAEAVLNPETAQRMLQAAAPRVSGPPNPLLELMRAAARNTPSTVATSRDR